MPPKQAAQNSSQPQGNVDGKATKKKGKNKQDPPKTEPGAQGGRKKRKARMRAQAAANAVANGNFRARVETNTAANVGIQPNRDVPLSGDGSTHVLNTRSALTSNHYRWTAEQGLTRGGEFVMIDQNTPKPQAGDLLQDAHHQAAHGPDLDRTPQQHKPNHAPKQPATVTEYRFRAEDAVLGVEYRERADGRKVPMGVSIENDHPNYQPGMVWTADISRGLGVIGHGDERTTQHNLSRVRQEFCLPEDTPMEFSFVFRPDLLMAHRDQLARN